MSKQLDELIEKVKSCRECEASLPLGANPVFSVGQNSKILIIGQAPGLAVHQTSVPWNDKSGDNLRQWLEVDKDTFYNTEVFSIMPMGFCYPGTGKNGDLPPKKECAPLWHEKIRKQLPNIQLTLLIGQYAQNYYLDKNPYKSLTETVKHADSFLPAFFPLPHPSPRNNIWMKRNDWFKEEILPLFRLQIQSICT